MVIARIARRLWQEEGAPAGRYHEYWKRVEAALNTADEERETAEILLQHQLLLERATAQPREGGPVRTLRALCDGDALAQLDESTYLVETTLPGVGVWGQTGHREKEGEEEATRSKRSTGDVEFASGVLVPPPFF